MHARSRFLHRPALHLNNYSYTFWRIYIYGGSVRDQAKPTIIWPLEIYSSYLIFKHFQHQIAPQTDIKVNNLVQNSNYNSMKKMTKGMKEEELKK